MSRIPARPALLFLAALLASGVAHASGGIHGTIETRDGKVLTGYIRWDRNEIFWNDLLDAQKDREVLVESRGPDVKMFGIRISKSDGRHRVRSSFSIPFGELASIEPGGSDRARLVLRSGLELDVHEGSTDLGDGIRQILIEDGEAGAVELEWRDLESIVFSAGPGAGPDAERLYGTVETRSARFTGFLVWDRDECLVTDILDGDEDGRSYKIPFAKIGSIARGGSRSAEVTLTDGRELELRGSNDVNRENRGIDVIIPGTGRVTVEWEEFRMVVFEPAPPSPGYGSFDGGARLAGSVLDTGGAEYTGLVTWDLDEEYTWERLDGTALGVEFSIPFSAIAGIEREGRRRARVHLRDGSTFVLEDSNDVDEDNKGIRVEEPDGSETTLSWEEFEAVRFD